MLAAGVRQTIVARLELFNATTGQQFRADEWPWGEHSAASRSILSSQSPDGDLQVLGLLLLRSNGFD